MIFSDTFVWLHLPKTGGTTMNKVFRERGIAGIWVDPDHLPAKHDSIALREDREGWLVGERRRFLTARRLDSWLVSDWKHKRCFMGLADLPFDPVRCGLFYSLRLGGVWVAADWWLRYFALDDQMTALRLEHLGEDLNRLMLPLLPVSTAPFDSITRENAAPDASGEEVPPFSEADLKRMGANNPVWSEWQRHIYGY